MENYKERFLQKQLEKRFFKGKVIIVYGARQVGKTTLIKGIQKKYGEDAIYLNCDEPEVREVLTDASSAKMKVFFGKKKLILLDEAQRIHNIGLSLKLLVDTYPELQVVATGSSSFELSNSVVEPLTGRNETFYLYPFSLFEVEASLGQKISLQTLPDFLIRGMYPEVVSHSYQEAEKRLQSLARDYLYKDILVYQDIRNSEVLEKLLQALALQIGNEVSYNELAGLLGIAKETVSNYIRILEQAFIIFRLNPFSKNPRTEIRRLRKIYFWDTGMRNAVIRNMNHLFLRQDVGALWENFILAERMKRNAYYGRNAGSYFWRTRQGQEIDYVEEESGKISAHKFKWGDRVEKVRIPKTFSENYPGVTIEGITPKNFRSFVGLESVASVF